MPENLPQEGFRVYWLQVLCLQASTVEAEAQEACRARVWAAFLGNNGLVR